MAILERSKLTGNALKKKRDLNKLVIAEKKS